MLRILRIPLIIAVIGAALLSSLVGALAFTLETSNVPDKGGVLVGGVVGRPLSINPVLCRASTKSTVTSPPSSSMA